MSLSSVHSINGTVSPIRVMLDAMNDGNISLIFDEAHATRVLWARRPRDGRTARIGGPHARPVAHVRQGARGVRWCVPVFWLFAVFALYDYRRCMPSTHKRRTLFRVQTCVTRETMVSTLCPPASTAFIRQHEYNSLRGHSPAPRIKGPTSHHDILL